MYIKYKQYFVLESVLLDTSPEFLKEIPNITSKANYLVSCSLQSIQKHIKSRVEVFNFWIDFFYSKEGVWSSIEEFVKECQLLEKNIRKILLIFIRKFLR